MTINILRAINLFHVQWGSNETCICLLRRLFFRIFLFMVFQVGLFAFPLVTSPMPYPSSSHPLPSPTPTSNSHVASTLNLLPLPPLPQPLLPFPYLLTDFSSPSYQPRNNKMQVVCTNVMNCYQYHPHWLKFNKHCPKVTTTKITVSSTYRGISIKHS